jgi:hypothetical protein
MEGELGTAAAVLWNRLSSLTPCSMRVIETQLRLGFRLYGLWFQLWRDLGTAALHVEETQLRFVEV